MPAIRNTDAIAGSGHAHGFEDRDLAGLVDHHHRQAGDDVKRRHQDDQKQHQRQHRFL
jgi:hypothetical protein